MALIKKWVLIFSPKSQKEFKKLDRPIQKRILDFFEKVILEEDPTIHAKPLRHQLTSLWSYRVGDYRVICRVEADILTIVAAKIAHRKDVYDFIPNDM